MPPSNRSTRPLRLPQQSSPFSAMRCTMFMIMAILMFGSKSQMMATAQSMEPSPAATFLSTSDPTDATASPTSNPTEATASPTSNPTEATSSPTSNPTEATASPTSNPTSAPTLKPSEMASSMPTPAETLPPTSMPTSKPTDMPTSQPTDMPTSQPTDMPTSQPTDMPTDMPTVPAATATPTAAGSEAPTAIPVIASADPSVEPTQEPVTASPSTLPSQMPSANAQTAMPTPVAVSGKPSHAPTSSTSPSIMPSAMPSELVPTSAVPSAMPSHSPSTTPSSPPTPADSLLPSQAPVDQQTKPPTSMPTSTPTISPTSAPTTPFETASAQGLQMTLSGVSSQNLGDASNAALAATIKSHVESFFAANDVYNVLDLTSTVTIATRRRFLRSSPADAARALQDDANLQVVVYDQTFEYRVANGIDPNNVTPKTLATQPFALAASRDQFRDALIATDDDALKEVTTVTDVIFPTVDPPTTAPTAAPTALPTSLPTTNSGGGGDSGLGTGALVGIIVGGVVALIIICVLAYLLCGKSDDSDDEDGEALIGGGREPPPAELKVKNKEDEVSALDGNAGATTANPNSIDSIAGYGDQSVATVDYDYSKAYGGGGDTSVSSAGGTFGSNTQGLSTLEAANAAATGGAVLGDGPSFSDTDSFEAHYRSTNANIKEEFIDIYAPAGKLGVVIDTPDDGAPVVHAVKDSSVIGDKIRVGDKLVAVDEEDVRSMTAIKVSKLISRKSANPSRKLSLIRTIVVE